MLILSRQKFESIVIGDNITVKVMRIDGNKVRLGISAPDDVEVHREEVFQRIQKERGCDGSDK